MGSVEYSVLIVDDDIWMQRVLSKTLQSYGFKKTYLASNGIDSIGKAVDNQPDLIVLDILMPELSGHLTLKILKSISLTKEIPVLMVSALSDVENLGRAVKSGTAGFISKPFTRTTVYEKLLDIYGREKLELIMKGMPIKTEELGYYSESDFKPVDPFSSEPDDNYDDDSDDDDSPVEDEDEEYGYNDFDSDDDAGSQTSVSKDRLKKHYKDEDRQSIESIKAMLLNKGK